MRNPTEYKLKTPKVVENTVVKAYKGIENAVVSTYKKIEDKFVDAFLEKDEQPDEAGSTCGAASPSQAHTGK